MSKFIDLTGQQFGYLTVLYRVPGTSPIKWHCRCKCGNECDVRGTYLRNNTTRSCGCLKKETAKELGIANLKDLSNQTFGYLTVLKRSDRKCGSNYYWICKCICGNIHEVAGSELTSGRIQSCGCQKSKLNQLTRSKNMIGKKFGLLTVIGLDDSKDSDSSYNYLCQCDCGNKKVVNGVSLRQGTTTSCGCINYSIGERNIENILKDNHIPFVKEYGVPELNYKRFDFAILDSNNTIKRLVEFDGRQHFEKAYSLWEATCPLETRQAYDLEKNNYAKEHNLPLIRIPYQERDNITLDMILGDQYLVI